MSDERIDPTIELPGEEGTDVEDVPETAGPVEQATPGSGALGRPDLSANPFAG